MYRKLQAVFGGRMRFAVSGGGPLGERLTHFFNGIGVKIFEGYGLTETSPTLTVNRADAWKPGTVGTPLASTSIRIADDGEILAKGPQVFQGYWHNEAATAEAFDDDGWFLTGDIGTLDDDGFLRITGRKKEIIVTAVRQERRARTARGPSARAPLDQRGGRRRRCPTVHRRADHPRPGSSHRDGPPQHGLGDVPTSDLDGERRPAGGHPVRSRRRQPVGVARRIDPGVRAAARRT